MLARELPQTQLDAFPLVHARNGDIVIVTRIDAGGRARKRLADLGVHVGSQARMVRCSVGSGPLILATKHDTRIALGMGMAQKIQVRLLSEVEES
jgi:Fe2+ transport system protein FeoA